jgi:hypothetical protein
MDSKSAAETCIHPVHASKGSMPSQLANCRKASFSTQVEILKVEGVLWRQRAATLSDAFEVPRVPGHRNPVAVTWRLLCPRSHFVGEPQEYIKALTW